MEIKATLQKPYTEAQRMSFIVQYNHNLDYKIEETATELQALGYTEDELAQQEKERIQELFMTRSDFFDGTIDAWGVGEDELLFLVQRMLTGLPLENKQKLKAINNFKNALNFYRKHDLFKMLIGTPIQLTETTQVIITEESLDKYFDEVAKGNKATAWQYLPQPVAIPIDPTEAEVPQQPSYDDI